MDWSLSGYGEAKLSNLTKGELKELCSQRELLVGGNKDELVRRLQSWVSAFTTSNLFIVFPPEKIARNENRNLNKSYCINQKNE